MKLNFSQFENSSNKLQKPIYPVNAKIILLSEHKTKKRSTHFNYKKSPYYFQKKDLNRSIMEKLSLNFRKEEIFKWIFITLTVSTLMTIFVLFGQVLSK